MESPVNKQIYQLGTKQECSKIKEGYISLEFLKNKEEEYLEKTFQKIESCKKRGYSYLDFGILVRTKKQAAEAEDVDLEVSVNVQVSKNEARAADIQRDISRGLHEQMWGCCGAANALL